jgi:hypothetical protein
VLLAIAAGWAAPASACTSILVTRGASADTLVMLTYSCDDPGTMGLLGIEPAAEHKSGEMFEIAPRVIGGEKGPSGRIPQVPHTFGASARSGGVGVHSAKLALPDFWKSAMKGAWMSRNSSKTLPRGGLPSIG